MQDPSWELLGRTKACPMALFSFFYVAIEVTTCYADVGNNNTILVK